MKALLQMLYNREKKQSWIGQAEKLAAHANGGVLGFGNIIIIMAA